jgi:hypothetical protein
MVTSILAVALVLLTIAVVCLFAMMGEMQARIGNLSGGTTGEWVEEMSSWVPPPAVESYPEALWPVAATERSVLLVLSTSCRSCADLLERGLAPLEAVEGMGLGIVVSTSTPERAERFLQTYPHVAEVPHFVDLGGDWTREHLNIDISPTAILLDRGLPQRAWSVTSAAELATTLVNSDLDQPEPRDNGVGQPGPPSTVTDS